jgi:hypothetical protein
MGRNNYFQEMEQRFGGGDEYWVTAQTPNDIQKSARKRIFKEMVNGIYDYEKVGKYFKDPKILENITVAAFNELQTYALLYNAVGYYKTIYPDYPNIGLEFTHITNIYYIYNVIYNKLLELRATNNLGVLFDIPMLLGPYRNDINNI